MLRLAVIAQARGTCRFHALALGLKPSSTEHAANQQVLCVAPPTPPPPAPRGPSVSTSHSNAISPLVHTAQAMQDLLQQLHADTSVSVAGGGQAASQRHLDRGKLLPRDRIAHIVDPGSPFLELSPLAGKGMYGASVVWHRGPVKAAAPSASPTLLGPVRHGERAKRGNCDGHRPRRRTTRGVCSKRCNRQGRHILPGHCEGQ